MCASSSGMAPRPWGKKDRYFASTLARILCLYQGARWQGVCGVVLGLTWHCLLLCWLLAVWPWESYLSSLSLRHLIWAMGIIKCFLKAVRRMEGDSEYQVLGILWILSGQELPASSPSL